ncbi:Lysine-specific histone demethylase 1B [Paragonimus westermani]|uniref:Lysine-specific histone demethylase 1B n=1 Tax=Paragonimus westermani TaxID=34504 RepID=A0A8T0DU12_9TREM|nr:Lysine-specific histone demethylase 1B [Paragonimus westermani]
MNVSGFELIQHVESSFCRNGFCGAILPLCFAGISPDCARNRSTSGWCHFSFGEHVCRKCFDFLSRKSSAHSVDSVWQYRLSAWRKHWIRKSSQVSKERAAPSVSEFLAAQLLPWWLQCRQCGQWRQLPPRTPIGNPDSPFRPDTFACRTMAKLCDDPCSWPADERTTLVLCRPHDFLASMQTHAWLQAPPAFDLLSMHGVDLTGLSADALPGTAHEMYLTGAELDTAVFKFGEYCPFSPVDLQAWERVAFPEMTRFPTLYLAVRNMVLCLWFSNPKRLLTSQFVSNHCFIRGLLRLVLCERWIPRLLEEFTCRGLINFGVCRPVEEEKPTPDNFQTVRIVGPVDVQTSIAARQIANGLRARSRPYHIRTSTDTLPSSSMFQVRFHPLELFTSVNLLSSALVELCIQLDPSKQSCSQGLRTEVTADRMGHSSGPTKTHNLSNVLLTIPLSCAVECQSLDRQPLQLERLIIPVHVWTDRVYAYSNHPISLLAQQMGLHLHPLSRCLLIFSMASDQSASMKSEVVPSDKMVRMEFHVEAVLDMVAQMSDPNLPTGLTEDRDKCFGKSVQDCWDRFDCDARSRLTDITESSMGRQLVEFYLSEVEYDLTEPLTTNSSGLIRRPCPTARLDLLPPCRYAEFVTDSTVESDSTSFDSNWHAQLLHGATPDVGVFSDLCASLLSVSSTDASESLTGVVGLSASGGTLSTDVKAQGSTSHCISSTPRLEDGPNEVDRTGSKLDHVGMHTSDGRLECVDWVVLLVTSDRLHFVFVDAYEVFSASSMGKPILGSSTGRKTSFPIYLPIHLKSSILEDFDELDEDLRTKPHRSDDAQEDNLARLITVTLVYPSAWWRPSLRQLMVDTEGSEQSESPTHRADEVTAELFAFLPDDRENRGFCHLFRDMYPQLSSPGVLQTQIFAAAADHWWSKGDAVLITMVDHHLTSRLVNSSTREYLIGSHVARMQHVTNSPSGSNIVRTTSILGDVKDEQVVRLRPNAWEVLARQCHILIPDLFPSLTGEVSNGFVKQPASVWNRCVPSTSRTSSSQAHMPGIDVLSSAVQSGLYTAERVLRCFSSLSDHATRAGSFSPSPLLIGHDRSLIDSSNCVEEFTGTGDDGDSSPHSSSFAGDSTVCVQQRFVNKASHFLKRTRPDEDVQSP